MICWDERYLQPASRAGAFCSAESIPSNRARVSGGIGRMSELTPSPSAHVWNDAALLAKARRYIEQMQVYSHDDWQYAFWSSLALELVARASLAKISPVLIADNSRTDATIFCVGPHPDKSEIYTEIDRNSLRF